MRAGSTVSCRRSAARSPGSRSRSVRTCQGLGPRRTVRGLALTPPSVLPSAVGNASASGITELSRLNGWPARSPADASPVPSRGPTHGSGPMWIAIPSSQWTLTTYSLPVSRRTPTVSDALLANGSETWTLISGRLRTRPSGRVGCLRQIVAGIDAVHSRAGRIPALGGKLVSLVESGFDRQKIFHFLLT